MFSFVGSQWLFAIEHKDNEHPEKVATPRYQYTGTNQQDVTDKDAWNDVTNTPPDSCDNEEELPCIVQFDSSDYTSIEAFLIDHPSFGEVMGAEELISTKSEG